MKKHIKNMIEFCVAALYAVYLKLFDKRPRSVVLYYHSVDAKHTPQFKKQMQFLVKSDHKVVLPSMIKDFSNASPQKLIAITFDDAFLSVMQNALPILKEHSFSACIFVPAGCIGHVPNWAVDQSKDTQGQSIMNESQLNLIARDGFEIASHSLTHDDLTELSTSQVIDQLQTSKRILEDIIGWDVKQISFPYGCLNDHICNIARQAGYKQGFTIQPKRLKSSTNPMQLPRVSVDPSDSLLKFKLKTSGAYEAVYFLRRIKSMILPSHITQHQKYKIPQQVKG